MAPTISRRESGALINSLTAGVVPRIGLRHIAVGQANEVNAFLNDMKTIEDGGASFRLISGQYGSGKSFLLQMIRNNAMDKNFVVADADLSPERKMTGSKGQGLSTYRELLQHLSTPTSAGWRIAGSHFAEMDYGATVRRQQGKWLSPQ